MPPVPVALQLYTVREEVQRDLAGTLRRVAEMGYSGVESGVYQGVTAEALKRLLDDLKLRTPATLTGLDALEQDIDGLIDYCLTIGSPYLVLSWLDPAEYSPANVPALAERLNGFGRRCRERGITFGYHNHAGEFALSDGAYPLDRLLDRTDPALVVLELDVYWASYAGADPAAYLRKRAGRVPLVHLKDIAPDGSFAEVGDGTLDLAAIFAAAEAGSVRWYVVEHDRPSPPALDSARRSLENLRALGKA